MQIIIIDCSLQCSACELNCLYHLESNPRATRLLVWVDEGAVVHTGL